MPRPLYPRGGGDLVLILQKAGWAPEPVWMGAENLAYRDSILVPSSPYQIAIQTTLSEHYYRSKH